jgi:hypothetical protein
MYNRNGAVDDGQDVKISGGTGRVFAAEKIP